MQPTHLIAVGFGSGLSPLAPGTFGTLAALPLVWLMAAFSPAYYLLIVVLCFWLGIVVCAATADDLGVHDHRAIVWDDVVGYLLTLWPVAFSWPAAIAGFVLFRIFAIVKPWPIGIIDKRLAGGWGIMLDDAVAALFAAVLLVVMQLVGWLPGAGLRA